jgi:hypothetical protein
MYVPPQQTGENSVRHRLVERTEECLGKLNEEVDNSEKEKKINWKGEYRKTSK